MHGEATMLLGFMEGKNQCFVVPVYQRSYAWKKAQCKQLYDDLLRALKQDRATHFFGSIVYTSDPESGKNQHLLIDGQQRITTVSLLLLALHHLLSEGALPSHGDDLARMILEEYLINRWQPEDKRLRLRAARDCQEAYDALYAGDAQSYIASSNITQNYLYFRERLLRQEVAADALFAAIERLQIIGIKLAGDDDAQLIFESLNSTGLALTEADKIRNYVLMNLPMLEQTRMYQQYWMKIEACTSAPGSTDNDSSAFFRDYLTVKNGKIPSLKGVYAAFKEYARDLDREPLMRDLLTYARYYRALLNASAAERPVSEVLRRLSRLECSVAYPFMMRVLARQEEGTLSAVEVERVFTLLEVFLLRRAMCGVPSNALNSLFLTLDADILRLDGTGSGYVSKMVYILLSKQGSGRFPRDEEFITALQTRDVFHMQPKNKLYVFERLENRDNREQVDVVGMLEKDEGGLTIEHIMPQTLSPQWIEDLGGREAAQAIHGKWLHRLANLTLTAYNSKYRNRPFGEKRDIPNGFGDSGLKMNQYIARCAAWNEDALQARNGWLAQEALSIWPLPQTDYAPASGEGMETFALDDEFDFTRVKLMAFTFLGVERRTRSWSECYAQLIGLMHEQDPSVLLGLATETDGIASQISADSGAFRTRETIGESLYLNTHHNTNVKMSWLRRFVERFELDPSQIRFTIARDEAETVDAKRLRVQIYQHFWTYVLEELNRRMTLFTNVSPGRESWINAGAGIGSGMQYSLMATKKMAGVHFECYSRSQAKNLALFDHMYAHREEIEQQMGMPLCWERNLNRLHSKVRIINADSNVYREDTWPEIRAFLIGRLERLYAVLQPVLESFRG